MGEIPHTKRFQSMKTATTWDIVCAANQHLNATKQNFFINQFIPGCYELILCDASGTTTRRRLGKRMDEATVRDFVDQVVFAKA